MTQELQLHNFPLLTRTLKQQQQPFLHRSRISNLSEITLAGLLLGHFYTVLCSLLVCGEGEKREGGGVE